MGFTMGFLKRLFGGTSDADKALLKSLLDLQGERIKQDAESNKLDHEIRLKTKEMELANLEKIGEEKRKDAEARARLRDIRRENLAKGRVKLQEKRAAVAATGGQPTVLGCTVCSDPRSVALTAQEIQWHNTGHPGAMQ